MSERYFLRGRAASEHPRGRIPTTYKVRVGMEYRVLPVVVVARNPEYLRIETVLA